MAKGGVRIIQKIVKKLPSYRVSEKSGICFMISIKLKKQAAGYIFNFKGGIHSSALSTKKRLYDIRVRRYEQIKMRYQVSKKGIFDNLES